MIISQTPLRISFAGGGTDLPSFYRAHGGGAVVSAAIDRYIHVLVNAKFDASIRVAYSETENVDSLEQLKHPLFREAMRVVGIHDSIEVHSIADIPSEGTGLGSSSTFTVGLLNALYAYKGIQKDPGELAETACRIEIDRLGGTLGKQDQYIAAYGGIRYFEFLPDDTVRVSPLPFPVEEIDRLSRHLSLFYTGITRKAQGILKTMDGRTATNRATLEAIRDLAGASRDALLARDYAKLGALLDDGWQMKRTLSPGITTPEIDGAYDRAKAAGAYGGKITGAGGGGFLLVMHPPGRSREIAAALPEMKHVPVHITPDGSRTLTVRY
ncbi:MAG TPA: GHMP kinase [Thermoplasmata archaeon]|nr:GHMP kinase [Thermoplasmata archaeon]